MFKTFDNEYNYCTVMMQVTACHTPEVYISNLSVDEVS